MKTLTALAVVALIAAGCGSNDTAHTSATASPEKASARDKAVKFSECIRAHGVADFPDPDAKGEYQYGVSVSPAVWQRATTACKDLQPPGTLSSKRTPKQQSTALKFAQCMRDHGIDMLTIGQYLQPSRDHVPVRRYVHPDTFAMFGREASAMGFRHAAVGAMVRSSYHADKQAEEVLQAGVD